VFTAKSNKDGFRPKLLPFSSSKLTKFSRFHLDMIDVLCRVPDVT
jgi:hypothetical protein